MAFIGEHDSEVLANYIRDARYTITDAAERAGDAGERDREGEREGGRESGRERARARTAPGEVGLEGGCRTRY